MRAGQCERAVFGGSCLFSCMPGFILTGYPILTCTQTGQWSPNPMPPSCQAMLMTTTKKPTTAGSMSCPPLMSPMNGVARGSCVNAKHGDICNFSCFAGSILSGMPVLTCNNGMWSSQPPVCRGNVMGSAISRPLRYPCIQKPFIKCRRCCRYRPPLYSVTGLQFPMTYPQIMTGTSQAPYMTSKVTKTTMDFYT